MINQKFSYIAFFDVDETVICNKSMFSFLKYYHDNHPPYIWLLNYFKYKWQMRHIKKLSTEGVPREEINIQYYQFYSGAKETRLKMLGVDWHKKCLREIDGFYNQRILNEIAFHKSKGAKIILVSGSFFACLEPIAHHVQADYTLSVSLEIINGTCTGKILNYPIIGDGKGKAIREYLEKIGYTNYSSCYAYGDHYSDLSMLNIVGNPVVVAGCEKLVKYAKEKNWRIILPTRV